uniref:Uncharacterized protein n=1 Tax=Amphimedon queenslandica TaxID=400682 RepID=A0A1X7U204_AMPQE
IPSYNVYIFGPPLAGGPPPAVISAPPPVAGGPPLPGGLPLPLDAKALHPAGAGPLNIAALQRQRQLIIWQLRLVNKQILLFNSNSGGPVPNITLVMR